LSLLVTFRNFFVLGGSPLLLTCLIINCFICSGVESNIIITRVSNRYIFYLLVTVSAFTRLISVIILASRNLLRRGIYYRRGIALPRGIWILSFAIAAFYVQNYNGPISVHLRLTVADFENRTRLDFSTNEL
jgi:hypothetical protein